MSVRNGIRRRFVLEVTSRPVAQRSIIENQSISYFYCIKHRIRFTVKRFMRENTRFNRFSRFSGVRSVRVPDSVRNGFPHRRKSDTENHNGHSIRVLGLTGLEPKYTFNTILGTRIKFGPPRRKT